MKLPNAVLKDREGGVDGMSESGDAGITDTDRRVEDFGGFLVSLLVIASLVSHKI